MLIKFIISESLLKLMEHYGFSPVLVCILCAWNFKYVLGRLYGIPIKTVSSPDKNKGKVVPVLY
jgi:hypothetical protein